MVVIFHYLVSVIAQVGAAKLPDRPNDPVLPYSTLPILEIENSTDLGHFIEEMHYFNFLVYCIFILIFA